MKTLGAVLAVGLALMGSASAQYYGERGDGYRDRGSRYGDRDDGYRDRGSRYGDRDDGYRDRGSRYGDRDDDQRGRGRNAGFDEREYLRCNPDVRRAVEQGKMQSGAAHYRVHGQREGRRLSC